MIHLKPEYTMQAEIHPKGESDAVVDTRIAFYQS